MDGCLTIGFVAVSEFHLFLLVMKDTRSRLGCTFLIAPAYDQGTGFRRQRFGLKIGIEFGEFGIVGSRRNILLVFYFIIVNLLLFSYFI